MAFLVLVRHGRSQWNIQGRWTGFADIPLATEGKEEDHNVGTNIKNISIDIAFTSVLKRAKQSVDEIKKVHPSQFMVIQNAALNERDYGDLTGKNKWDLKKEYGNDRFDEIRRGWNTPIPHGETLKDVYDRVVPYYQKTILPYLKKNNNVLIVAHGNSLRALVKYLENINNDDIAKLEIATGEVYIYTIDGKGHIRNKEKKLSHPNSL